MKRLLATICLLTLTGCAAELPYSIAIGDPSASGQGAGRAHCVLRLDDIVKTVATDYQSSPIPIRSLQIQIEKSLAEHTQALGGCTHRTPPPIEEVAKKWLTSYAVDATDPDQELDRFREYVRSAKLVQQLAQRQLLPDQDPRNTYRLVEQSAMRQSQWCGPLPLAHTAQPQPTAAATGEDSSCLNAQSLYHVTTSPTDLYDQLLSDMTQAEAASTPRSQRYIVLGYELPWDEDRTLVRYGVTFYFKHIPPESNLPSTGTAARLIGYDLVYANEASPKPLLEPVTTARPEQSPEKLSPWQDNPWRITGYPFSLVIGLKNAAFELVKIPFSAIAGLAFGRDRMNYPLENLETAYNALYVEATTQTRGGAEWGLYRLLIETPLVGQLFQYNFSFDRSEKDEVAQDTSIRRKLFLSRGIYGGNKWGQDTGLWALFAKHSYPTYDVYSPPYRHGTVIDVVWSMFNLSHGPAYSEVRYILDHASREDRLYLAGHSGGVQRSAAASQILTHHKYRVVKAVGIAGPSIGQALVDPRYPEAFKVYLNTGSGANQDVVSKVGVVAGGFSTLLDYAVIVPLKYTVGNLVAWKRDDIYQAFDRIGFSNATIVEVARKPSSRHQTPLRLSFTDRLVFDAYLRDEFATAFREDLERPDSPHGTEREHAVPWGR